jgi:hypothetical protein
MSINFQNAYGQIDLNLIRDEDVAALSEPRKLAINLVISTVMCRMSAEQRLAAARTRVRVAMKNEDECLAVHMAASPPVTFMDARAAAILAFNNH